MQTSMKILMNKILKSTGFLISLLVINSILVYITGGVESRFIWIYYLLIILFAINQRVERTIGYSLVTGLILLPLVFISVNNQPKSSFLEWLTCFLLFLLIAFISGIYFDYQKNKSTELVHELSFNKKTNIPNINSINSVNTLTLVDNCFIYKVIVKNHKQLKETFGFELYFDLLVETYHKLKSSLPTSTLIFQLEENTLTLLIKKDNEKDYQKYIVELLSDITILNNIAIYIDYEIILYKNKDMTECKELLNIRTQSHRNTKTSRKSIFNPEKKEGINSERIIELFPKAIADNELKLVYQPIIINETKKIKGFECLVRWHSQRLGLIMPDDFIDIIEMTSLIQDLTDFVIRAAMNKQKEFNKHNHNIYLSINISVKNLQDPNFFKRVKNILDEMMTNPKNIIFEITETKFLSNTPIAKINLRKLREFGFKIAIDDFGKGFSSFSYLADFNIDVIKIDKYFLLNLEKNNDNYIIIKVLVELAHKLNLVIVAEGIETEKIYNIIKELNCDYLQGFYFARPIDEAKTLSYYQNHLLTLE